MSLKTTSFSSSFFYMFLFVSIIFTNCTHHDPLPSIKQGDYETVKKNLSKYIQKQMKKKNVPGIAFALITDKKVILEKGFGFSDKKTKRKIHPKTLFRIGSLSKPVTVLGALKLIEEKKIKLNDPITKYLPNFSIKNRLGINKANAITIRSLMTHHSGLPYGRVKGLFSSNPDSLDVLLKLIQKETLAHSPNTFYSYSNLGMNLLGIIVSKVSGIPFEEYIKKNIFKPLAIENSTYSLKQAKKNHLTKGYKKGKVQKILGIRDKPAGGLFSSVHEYSKIIRMVLNQGEVNQKTIFKKQTIEQMTQAQNKHVILDMDYEVALGFLRTGPPDLKYTRPFLLHDGGTPYFHSMLIILPKYQLGVVVLANADTGLGPVHDIAFRAIKLALSAKEDIHPPKRPSLEKLQRIPLRKVGFENAFAYYDSLLGILKLTKRGEKLITSAFGVSVHFTPRENKRFTTKVFLFDFIPIPMPLLKTLSIGFTNIQGNEMIFLDNQGRKMSIGSKLKKVPISQTWKNRLGSYFIENQGEEPSILTDIKLGMKDSYLTIEFKVVVFGGNKIKLALQPLNDHEAYTQGFGALRGEKIEFIKKNGLEKLFFSGYRLSKK